MNATYKKKFQIIINYFVKNDAKCHFFGSPLMKGFHLAAMLEFFNFYCKVENSLPETHIVSINSFSIFKIPIHYHRI